MSPTTAAADADQATKLSCIQQHAQAQRAMNAARLLEARARLDACANASCPTAIRDECSAWLDGVQQGIPTLTILVRDPEGRPVRQVRILVDGAAISESQFEAAIALDPGTHVLRIEHDRGGAIERTVQLDRGSGGRIVTVEVPVARAASSPASPAPSAAPAPAAAPAVHPDSPASGAIDTRLASSAAPYAYGLLALGVVGVGSFTWFGLSGRRQQTELETNCAPACASADIDRMRRDYAIADVSLGVGLVSLGAAAYVFATQREVDAEPDTGLLLGPRSAGWVGRF